MQFLLHANVKAMKHFKPTQLEGNEQITYLDFSELLD